MQFIIKRDDHKQLFVDGGYEVLTHRMMQCHEKERGWNLYIRLMYQTRASANPKQFLTSIYVYALYALSCFSHSIPFTHHYITFISVHIRAMDAIQTWGQDWMVQKLLGKVCRKALSCKNFTKSEFVLM